jgi:hypothetical protein
LAVGAVYAQQGPFGNGMGQGMMRGGMMHGQMLLFDLQWMNTMMIVILSIKNQELVG